jgi:hypothetical protein
MFSFGTRNFLLETRMFSLETRNFSLETRSFLLPTKNFSLETRIFSFATRNFSLHTATSELKADLLVRSLPSLYSPTKNLPICNNP